MRAITFIRYIFSRFPFLLITNIILLLLTSLIDAASIFSLIVVVDLFINPSLNSASPLTKQIVNLVRSIGLPISLVWLLGIFLFFNTLKIILQIFSQYSILRTKYRVLREIMIETFQDFFNTKWYFFSSGKQGVLLNTFIREITVVGDAFGAIASYFSTILQIILYLVVPFYLSWQVTSVILVAALIFVLPFFLLGKISYKLGKLNTSTGNLISSVIQESLSLAKIIMGFGNQRKSVKSLEQAFDAHRHATLRSQTLSFAMPLMYYPFALFVLIIGLFVARKFTLPLAETAILFYSLVRVVPFFGQLTAQKHCLDNFFPSYEQIINLRQRAKQLKQLSGNKVFSGFSKEVTFENVYFAYPEHEPVLVGINARIPKGKMVAFVGESGVGKSTLIDLIVGLHEPTSGCMSFDGVPLSEFDINSYRKRIGYVPQDSVLFNLSIRDNLLWADEKATEDEIIEACGQANAEEFIKKLPEGYDTLVGDRGVRLSGGQIQRIALARAILRKPDLLILDEATSSLDSYSERLIQQAIETIARETTVIVVAHRLSTIRNADYIYVMKNGRIAEQGTYAELIHLNGQFSRMVQLQTLETAK